MKQGESSSFKTSHSWDGKIRHYKLPAQNKLAFSGPIYVLVNGKTYSAGASLARYLREYGNAITIGEEGGTRYEGYVAGSQQAVFLPNSNLKIAIPRYHNNFPASLKQKTQNRGLIPDHIVTYSIDDLIQERDLEMEFVTKLINKSAP